MNVVCIGMGAIGLQVANLLAKQGNKVTGVSRSYKENAHADVKQVCVDIFDTQFADKLTASVQNPHNKNALWDVVIVTLSPSEYSADGYKQAYFETAKPICKLINVHAQSAKVIFISSTGVYGQNSGEVINEHSVPEPTSVTSQYILDAENYYRANIANTNNNTKRVCCIRPSGIYGVTRLRMLKIALQKNEVADTHWSNRIFDTDLVKIICTIASTAHHDNEKLQNVYIATDSTPALQKDVVSFLRSELSTSNESLIKTNKGTVTGKQIHSLYIDETWLDYPTWKHGYTHIIKSIDTSALDNN